VKQISVPDDAEPVLFRFLTEPMKQDATNRFDASGDREKASRIEVRPMGVVVLDQASARVIDRLSEQRR
jgi:hypothetical protein